MTSLDALLKSIAFCMVVCGFSLGAYAVANNPRGTMPNPVRDYPLSGSLVAAQLFHSVLKAIANKPVSEDDK